MKNTDDDDGDDETATSTAVTVNTARDNCIILNKLLLVFVFVSFSKLMSIVLMTQLDELFRFSREHINKKKDLLQPFRTDLRINQHEVHKSKK